MVGGSFAPPYPAQSALRKGLWAGPLLCALACVLQVAPPWWAVMKQQLRSGGVWAVSGASGGPGGAQSTVPHCVSLASSQASVAVLWELGAHTELTVAGSACVSPLGLWASPRHAHGWPAVLQDRDWWHFSQSRASAFFAALVNNLFFSRLSC